MDKAARDLAMDFARLADEKKAADIVVVDLDGIAFFADYFVIATGLNERHLRGLADELKKHAKSMKVRPLYADGLRSARWILLDYGSVIVHLFNPEARTYYELDQLWADAPRVDWQSPRDMPART